MELYECVSDPILDVSVYTQQRTGCSVRTYVRTEAVNKSILFFKAHHSPFKYQSRSILRRLVDLSQYNGLETKKTEGRERRRQRKGLVHNEGIHLQYFPTKTSSNFKTLDRFQYMGIKLVLYYRDDIWNPYLSIFGHALRS